MCVVEIFDRAALNLGSAATDLESRVEIFGRAALNLGSALMDLESHGVAGAGSGSHARGTTAAICKP